MPHPNQRKPVQFQRAQTAKVEQTEQKAQAGQVNPTARSRASQLRWVHSLLQISKRIKTAVWQVQASRSWPHPLIRKIGGCR